MFRVCNAKENKKRQFFIVFTVIDHRNDVKWSNLCSGETNLKVTSIY